MVSQGSGQTPQVNETPVVDSLQIAETTQKAALDTTLENKDSLAFTAQDLSPVIYENEKNNFFGHKPKNGEAKSPSSIH